LEPLFSSKSSACHKEEVFQKATLKAGERGADVDAINESVELADEIYVDTSIPAMIATKFEPQKKAPISGGPTLF
jgi:hypothetical protein